MRKAKPKPSPAGLYGLSNQQRLVQSYAPPQSPPGTQQDGLLSLPFGLAATAIDVGDRPQMPQGYPSLSPDWRAGNGIPSNAQGQAVAPTMLQQQALTHALVMRNDPSSQAMYGLRQAMTTYAVHNGAKAWGANRPENFPAILPGPDAYKKLTPQEQAMVRFVAARMNLGTLNKPGSTD